MLLFIKKKNDLRINNCFFFKPKCEANLIYYTYIYVYFSHSILNVDINVWAIFV